MLDESRKINKGILILASLNHCCLFSTGGPRGLAVRRLLQMQVVSLNLTEGKI